MLLKCAAIYLIPFDNGLASKSSQRDYFHQENVERNARETSYVPGPIPQGIRATSSAT